ncbi:MAG: aminotransferase class V-fold PLP-dependent enzyme, partial [Verrucomicrobiota bacterium]
GEQEGGMRAGTENFPAVAAMLAALEAREAALLEETTASRDAFEAALRKAIPGVQILASEVPRLPNTSLCLMPRHPNTRWVARLDKLGFQVSTGSACATGKEEPSHVLHAHGIDADAARRAVRVSGGWTQTREDWLALAEAFAKVWQTLEAETEQSQVISI